MELRVSTYLFDDRRSFLGLAGLVPKAKEAIHGVNYTSSYIDCVEIYVDQICLAAYFHFPDEVIEAVISMLSEELLTEICMLETMPRLHRDEWLDTWLRISVIDDFLEQIFPRSFGREARNRSAGPRVLRQLIR